MPRSASIARGWELIVHEHGQECTFVDSVKWVVIDLLHTGFHLFMYLLTTLLIPSGQGFCLIDGIFPVPNSRPAS